MAEVDYSQTMAAQAKSGSYNVSRSSDGDEYTPMNMKRMKKQKMRGSPEKGNEVWRDEPQKELENGLEEQKTDTSIEATQ